MILSNDVAASQETTAAIRAKNDLLAILDEGET